MIWAKNIISLAIITGLAFASPLFYAHAMTPDAQPVYKGADVSSWEPDFDFALANQQGIQVIYLRTSLGMNDKDKAFRKQITAAQAVGIKVGGYHFLYLGNGWTWQNNLNNALQAVDRVSFDCKYVIDFEQEGLKDSSLSKAEITSDVLNFANSFTAKTGIPCMLYASTAFINEHFTQDIQQLPIWIADYRKNPNLDANGIYTQWAGFQYTDEAPISNATIDADYFTESVLLDNALQPSTSVPDASNSQATNVSTLIRKGDRGATVSALQSELNKFGYGLDVDGIFGNATYRAVIDFQRSHGLDADGVVGPATMAKLDSTTNVNTNVLAIQKKLNELHITDSNGNRLSEDGISGNHTKQAISRFESVVKIDIDGIWGKQCESAYDSIVAHPTLQIGAKSIAVRYVQYRTGIHIDGVYGNQTQKAVHSYEIKNRLHVDAGIVGKQMWNALLK